MLNELTMKENYNGIYIYSYCYFREYEEEETVERGEACIKKMIRKPNEEFCIEMY